MSYLLFGMFLSTTFALLHYAETDAHTFVPDFILYLFFSMKRELVNELIAKLKVFKFAGSKLIF